MSVLKYCAWFYFINICQFWRPKITCEAFDACPFVALVPLYSYLMLFVCQIKNLQTLGYGIIILLLIEVSMCFDSVPFILYPRNDFEKHSEKSAITTGTAQENSAFTDGSQWIMAPQPAVASVARLPLATALPPFASANLCAAHPGTPGKTSMGSWCPTLLQFLVLQVQLLLLVGGELNCASKSYPLVN